MEPNELRISNLVTDLDGDVMSISEITKDYVSFSGCNLKSRYGKIQPIPLTEDWLIRFGFKRIHDGVWSNGTIELNYVTQDDYYEFEFRFPFSEWMIRKLKFVHLLQNLYFALTGTELTLKN